MRRIPRNGWLIALLLSWVCGIFAAPVSSIRGSSPNAAASLITSDIDHYIAETDALLAHVSHTPVDQANLAEDAAIGMESLKKSKQFIQSHLLSHKTRLITLRSVAKGVSIDRPALAAVAIYKLHDDFLKAAKAMESANIDLNDHRIQREIDEFIGASSVRRFESVLAFLSRHAFTVAQPESDDEWVREGDETEEDEGEEMEDYVLV